MSIPHPKFGIPVAAELLSFRAMQYVIDLVAGRFTRELGPLLTPVSVSGRSGSAFAVAEIGAMKSVVPAVCAMVSPGNAQDFA
jgi:ABC-type transporter Mla maintaining outer membrane lipid asymmetry permease subunit MlaE